ncbi:MAG: Na+/H+ antiporter subunit E [Thermoleophilia bacterium]|nr:Na+/H+ antiporter subunit E [Thermoleophilia bacterium]
MRVALAAVLLAAVYALALASTDPVDLATGLVLGAALVVGLRRHLFTGAPAPASALPRRLLRALPLAAAVLREIAVGTWQVTLVVLHLRPLRSPGIVAVPIGGRTRLGVAVTGLLTTLAPGEFLVDVDWRRGVMLVHVLDASEPDAVRERYARFYERYQRPVLP